MQKILCIVFLTIGLFLAGTESSNATKKEIVKAYCDNCGYTDFFVENNGAFSFNVKGSSDNLFQTALAESEAQNMYVTAIVVETKQKFKEGISLQKKKKFCETINTVLPTWLTCISYDDYIMLSSKWNGELQDNSKASFCKTVNTMVAFSEQINDVLKQLISQEQSKGFGFAKGSDDKLLKKLEDISKQFQPKEPEFKFKEKPVK